MIDLIRVKYRNNLFLEEHIIENVDRFPELISNLKYHIGEVAYPYKCNFQNLKIKINDKSAFIEGSIHKFYNINEFNQNHNYNDFNYEQLVESIEKVNDVIPDFENQALTQLEFGLNIELDKPAEVIITRNIFLHKEKAYNINRKYSGKGEFMQYMRSNYYIKIYDKAKQYEEYNLNNHILRIELKFIKAREFNKIGIYKISDLKNKRNLNKLFDLLRHRFDELYIVDEYLDSPLIPTQVKQELSQLLTEKFWNNVKGKSNWRKKTEAKSRLKHLLQKHNLLNSKISITKSLEEKYRNLIN